MQPALIVFAKHPVPGKVKTRLARHCGDTVAADIAIVLLTETIKLASNAWPGPRKLYCWPDTESGLFKQLARDYDFELVAQCPGPLGDKMFSALANESKQHGSAAVMGADVPHCPQEVLSQGFELMSDNKSVIGPASDGGYYFLGLQKPDKEIFSDIDWGSEEVFVETIKRADVLGIKFKKLTVLQDIDNWQDLVAASENLPGLKKFVDPAST